MGRFVDRFSLAPTHTYIKIHRFLKVGGFIFTFWIKNSKECATTCLPRYKFRSNKMIFQSYFNQSGAPCRGAN